jgi:CheY-like chemotaxis protein
LHGKLNRSWVGNDGFVLITIETKADGREISRTIVSHTFHPDQHRRAAFPIGVSIRRAIRPPVVLQRRIMSRIAIYEENDLMRALLTEWLSGAGYRVRAAAPNRVPRGGADDLVLVSIYMPKDGGAHFLRDIRDAHPGIPLIAISAQFRSGLSAAGPTAEVLGVQRVLAKPLSRADLLDAVSDILGPPS